MYVCMYVYVYVCMRTYAYICICMYILQYTQNQFLPLHMKYRRHMGPCTLPVLCFMYRIALCIIALVALCIEFTYIETSISVIIFYFIIQT